jgi:hypothetical protein
MKKYLLLVVSVLSFSQALAKESERKPSAANADLRVAKDAIPVAKTDRFIVYKFVDEVDGRHMVCYFPDSLNTAEAPGGISCTELK